MSIESFFLPEGLLIEILVCLPVTTLLRFKSVCKSWLALINSSDFIHRHASTTTTTDHNTSSASSKKLGSFIFQSRHLFLNSYKKKHEVSWNIFAISGDHEFQVYEDLGMPPCYRKPMNSLKRLLMVGSCNGVICLYDYKLRDVSLWNPTIHQFRILPKSLTFTGIGDLNQDFVAFGFDVETKDYKVVLVTYFSPPRTDNQQRIHRCFRWPHRVQVYCLSTDSWRTLEDVVLPINPVPNQGSTHGGYLNGSHYCLGWKLINTNIDELTGNSSNQALVIDQEILSFDFTKEIFKTMQLPDGINNMCVLDGSIGIIFLGEKIAIVVYHLMTFDTDEFIKVNNYDFWDDFIKVNTYDFWVLNEFGVKESWTKLYTIGPYETVRRPIGISINGEFIFVVTSNAEMLWLLNLSTQVMKELQWDGNQIICSYVYRSSLVPVCSSTRNGSTSALSLKFHT